MKKAYGFGGRFLGRSVNEIKAARRGIVHRAFSDGTAIVNLEGGGVVRASARVIGDLYPLKTGQAVKVDVAEDGESAASIALA